jgi:xylan 1,4-beta-xylosidase
VKINFSNVPEGNYMLEVYKIGYHSNDAYSTYLAMGKPTQLTKQQVEQIKSQNDGSAVLKEIVTIKTGTPFLKELEIRENDVFFLNLIKL